MARPLPPPPLSGPATSGLTFFCGFPNEFENYDNLLCPELFLRQPTLVARDQKAGQLILSFHLFQSSCLCCRHPMQDFIYKKKLTQTLQNEQISA